MFVKICFKFVGTKCEGLVGKTDTSKAEEKTEGDSSFGMMRMASVEWSFHLQVVTQSMFAWHFTHLHLVRHALNSSMLTVQKNS